METHDDPPCDFDVFVAQRRDISQDEAQQLVCNWLSSYVPRAIWATCSPSLANQQEVRHA